MAHNFGISHSIYLFPKESKIKLFCDCLSMGWYGMMWSMISYMMWCDVMWCDVIWCDVMWCEVTWCGKEGDTSNGSWRMDIKGEMSGTVCVTFTWDMYIYIWVVYSLCFFCCLFITVTWWYVWCIEWASGNQEEVQACLVTLWLFIISCYSLYKTTLGLLCSWFENNPHFHKYSMDFHV